MYADLQFFNGLYFSIVIPMIVLLLTLLYRYSAPFLITVEALGCFSVCLFLYWLYSILRKQNLAGRLLIIEECMQKIKTKPSTDNADM